MPEPGQVPRPKSSPMALIANWMTYDAPFAAKLRMAASNTLIKLRNHQVCCPTTASPAVECRPIRPVRAVQTPATIRIISDELERDDAAIPISIEHRDEADGEGDIGKNRERKGCGGEPAGAHQHQQIADRGHRGQTGDE